MILSPQPSIAQIERLIARWPDYVRMLPDGRIEIDLAEEDSITRLDHVAVVPEAQADSVDTRIINSPIAPGEIRNGVERKLHYGSGTQPWDVIVASGWGPAFAAGNVVKYLRRTKAPEHSLESARWYYARLYEGAAAEPDEQTELAAPWGVALARLEALLTREELARVRGTR